MTMKAAKSQLTRLLQDKENRVIALTGKWGTGKTHMLHEVRAESKDDAVKQALYVSLFGLSDMNHIKLKIAQGALPKSEKNKEKWRFAADVVVAAKRVTGSLHAGFSAVDELALLAVPLILKNRVIVLDDIERKHDSLSIDQVLGFIDEFTQRHSARFILVLNTDQLDNRPIWDVLREKVIDQEVRLDTSSAEAFSISIALTPSRYEHEIGDAIQKCGVTNIRVVRKVIRAVNQILGDRDELSAAVLARVVPSIVLLAAINYRGIDDGPDFQYVLRTGRYLDQPDEPEDASDAEKKRASTWDLLLSELGIASADEFELQVVEFMQSGMFDATAVSQTIDRYVAENDAMVARGEVNSFQERIMWDHRCTEEELLAEADKFRGMVHFLDAYHVTSLVTQVSGIAGGEKLGDDLIETWLKSFQPHARHEDDDLFNRPLHPRIKEAVAEITEREQATTSVVDACMHIMMHSGWGTRQEVALKAATVSDFERAIRTREMPDFRRFMKKMLEISDPRGNYKRHFGSASDHFTVACRNIMADASAPRLARLLEILFVHANLQSLLQEDSAESGPVEDAH